MVRLAFALLLVVLLFPLKGWSQTSDFFSNTQSTSKLSTGTAGACSNCPGFNPDTLIRHSGKDPDGAGGATFSLSVTTDAPSLGVTPAGNFFFSLLGPGAITDNMFGVIALASTGDPVQCQANTPTGVPPSATATGINCGDLRFDPASQGMTVPTFPAADVLQSVISSPATFLGDSNTANLNFGTGSDFHASIDLKNRFIWNNTTDPITDVDLTVACTAGTVACVGSKQQEKEVIAVSGTAFGTLNDPGPVEPGPPSGIGGEQVFDQTTDWSLINNSGNNFANTATPPTALTINWTQRIQNPVFGDNIDGVVDLNFANREFDTSAMSGSFLRDNETATNATTFPTTTMPMMSSSIAASPCTGAPVGTCTTIP